MIQNANIFFHTELTHEMINGRFTTSLPIPFIANYVFIFHKTEVQTVILRCLMSPNLNWFKWFDTKRK